MDTIYIFHLCFIFTILIHISQFFAAMMNSATDGNITAGELHEICPTIEQVLRAIASDNGDCSSLRCTLCDKMFRNRGSRHFHMRRKHGQEQPETSTALLGVEPGQRQEGPLAFRCPMDECAAARTRFSSAKLLIQHVQKKHTEKRHKCAKCPARFSLERDLRYHCKKVCSRREQHQKLGTETVPAPKTSEEQAKTNPIAATIGGRSAAILLMPIRLDKRILLRRILPKSAQKRTASTQTEVADDDSGLQQQQQTVTTTTTWLPPNVNDGGQFVGNFYMGQDVATNTEFIAGGALAENVQQHQQFVPDGAFINACVQTCYPQTLDFGAQYPTNPCCTSSSSSIYLPPLLVASSTQTHHPHHLPASMNQPMPTNITYNGEDGIYSRKCPLRRQSSWTQTMADEGRDVHQQQPMMTMDWGEEEVDELMMMERMDYCSSSSAMASVGAQTDEDAEHQKRRRMEEEWFDNSVKPRQYPNYPI